MSKTDSIDALLTTSPQWTIAVAESVTCGLVQARIGAIPTISQVFKGGITAYAIDQKVRYLGVDPGHASHVDCVSARVADEMAAGVCCMFSSTIGVATTGYADEVKSPYAFWAICYNDGASLKIIRRGKRVSPAGLDRVGAQHDIAESVFDALIKELKTQRKIASRKK